MAIGQWAGRVGPLRIIALTPVGWTWQPSVAMTGSCNMVYTYLGCKSLAYVCALVSWFILRPLLRPVDFATWQLSDQAKFSCSASGDT
jgi:hypothetical protein